MMGHVEGPLGTFTMGPGSLNISIVTILMVPICQSRPKMGQNGKITILCINVILFGSNGQNTIRKQSYWVSIG